MNTVRVGIGGWDFAPWRGLFYPEGLRKADQLGYAAARLTSIEINATFYRTQSAKTFRNWRDGTPEGFVFAVKAARAAAQRTDAEEAKPAVARFLGSGADRTRRQARSDPMATPSAKALRPRRARPLPRSAAADAGRLAAAPRSRSGAR